VACLGRVALRKLVLEFLYAAEGEGDVIRRINIYWGKSF